MNAYYCEMLFVWCTDVFVGYYAKMASPDTPIDSLRHMSIRNYLTDRFKTAKSHMFWRHAYGCFLCFLDIVNTSY